jgi:hypothetical protein
MFIEYFLCVQDGEIKIKAMFSQLYFLPEFDVNCQEFTINVLIVRNLL